MVKLSLIFIVFLQFSYGNEKREDILKKNLEQLNKVNKEFTNLSKKTKKSGSEILQTLEKEKSILERNIIFEITGVDPPDSEKYHDPTETGDLFSEVKKVLFPLINTVKRASSKPRKIETLKSKIDFYHDIILNQKTIIEKLSNFLSTNKNRADYQFLTTTLERYKDKKISNEFLKAQYERQLSELTKNKKNLYETLKEVFSGLIKTKGKNLLLSFLIFFFVYFFTSKFRKKLFSSSLFSGQFEWLRRPLFWLYHSLCLIFATICSLINLYILQDWFLITLIVMFFMGVFWSMRQVLPTIFDEVKLIFNLGTVRENERIIYKGLPWRVKSLGMHCVLVNDRLQGAQVRVPAKIIMEMQSRYPAYNEEWFPTQKGDWVLLADGSYGQIILQTPEFVRIVNENKEKYSVATIDFLKLSPRVLNSGFKISQTFGLDYALQGQITNKVLEDFKSSLQSYFQKEIASKELFDIEVSFNSADDHCLSLFIRLSFSGGMAGQYYSLKRSISSCLVETCQKFSYSIPFPQMVVHKTDASSRA